MKTVVLSIVLVALLSFDPAAAAETKTRGPLDLRSDRYVDAPVVAKVAGDTSVEAVKTEAGWVQVRAGGQVGWVRATGLTGDGATVASLARLDSGRSASGNLVVAAGIRRIPKASKHALIITVESAGARRWPGVNDDRIAGRLIAGRLGVPDENVVEADADGIAALTASLQALNDRVQPGDRLFVYFSGPGTQEADGACVPAWALPGGTLSAARLTGALKPALTRADKTLFIVDAGYANDRTARKGVPSNCRSGRAASDLPIVAAAVAAGVPQQNVVAIQSAAGADQGLDAPGGGLFTQGLADCVLGDAADTDGSASISIAELATCVNARGRNGPLAAVTGNAGWSPIVGVASARVVPPGTAPPRAAIDDVLAQRDGRIDVGLTATPSTLRIGRDVLGLTLTSSRAGFVYLVLLGSDGKSFYLLFPNDLDRDNRIAGGETLRLPRPGWQVQAQGPAGRDTVLAIVAESERDLAPFAAHREGPFGTALTDGDGRAQLQWLLGRSRQAGTDDCVGGGARRNLAAVRVCSDAFGAAVVEVVEE